MTYAVVANKGKIRDCKVAKVVGHEGKFVNLICLFGKWDSSIEAGIPVVVLSSVQCCSEKDSKVEDIGLKVTVSILDCQWIVVIPSEFVNNSNKIMKQ